MPPLYIEFMPETLDEVAAQKLKDVLRKDTSERFSVTGRPLTEDDMTVIFVQLHEWSEPTHDIVVRIQLHHDEERLENGRPDRDAQEIADKIAEALAGLLVDQEFTIGVAPLYAEIGWGTATVSRNHFDVGNR